MDFPAGSANAGFAIDELSTAFRQILPPHAEDGTSVHAGVSLYHDARMAHPAHAENVRYGHDELSNAVHQFLGTSLHPAVPPTQDALMHHPAHSANAGYGLDELSHAVHPFLGTHSDASTSLYPEVLPSFDATVAPRPPNHGSQQAVAVYHGALLPAPPAFHPGSHAAQGLPLPLSLYPYNPNDPWHHNLLGHASMHAVAPADVHQTNVHLQPMPNHPAYAPSAADPSQPEPILAAAYGSSDPLGASRARTDVRAPRNHGTDTPGPSQAPFLPATVSPDARRSSPEQLQWMRESPFHAQSAYKNMQADARYAAELWLLEVGERLLSKERLKELPGQGVKWKSKPKMALADEKLRTWMQMVFEARKLDMFSQGTIESFLELKLEPGVKLANIRRNVRDQLSKTTSPTETQATYSRYQREPQGPFDTSALMLYSPFVIGDVNIVSNTKIKKEVGGARILGLTTVEGGEFRIHFGILTLRADAAPLLPRWTEFRDEWNVEGVLSEPKLEPINEARLKQHMLEEKIRRRKYKVPKEEPMDKDQLQQRRGQRRNKRWSSSLVALRMPFAEAMDVHTPQQDQLQLSRQPDPNLAGTSQQRYQ
ncbi:hypothetical protein ACQY0O_007884 [Thecaphora frezii]